jgi:signal transduction histidine kinase
MRAPLRAMCGFAEILLEEHSSNLSSEGRDYLKKIGSAAHRLDALIQEMLTYTRVLRAEVKNKPINLDAIVREAIETYPQLQAVDITLNIEGTLPVVWGSEASLAQCVSNLLTNAVKFVAPGVKPQIKIWAEAKGTDVVLFVQDNGIGIAPQDQDRIFNIFERVGGGTAYEGTGMGLAIVRKAVQRMGGTLGVESDAGRGSKFWIQLRGSAA